MRTALRSLPALIVLLAVLVPVVHSQTAANALKLPPEPVPADCRTIDGYFPVDTQTAILWEKTDLY